MRPCRHGLIGDHTVFHVVASCRANPAMVAPSKRNCRIAQRIASVPRRARGAHTFSLCSRNVAVWPVRSRYLQRRIVPPEPHRNPAPGRVDHLHHHAPVTVSKSPHNPDSAQRTQDSLSRTRPHSCRATQTRRKPSKSTSRPHRPSGTEQQQAGSDTTRGP